MKHLMPRALAALCGVFVALAGVSALAAQGVTEPALKAAYLYNFVRFTDWPADALEKGAPLDICVMDPQVADALEPMVVDKSVGDHAVMVRRLTFDTASRVPGKGAGFRVCEMVYMGRLDLKSAQDVLTRVTDQPVLTVSDLAGFTRVGGIARLFLEGANLRFEINVDATRRARLQMSALLLQRATIVKDEK